MKQNTDSPISSTAPNEEEVAVTVNVDDSGITVSPDCVTVDWRKKVIWRFAVPEGRILDRKSVQFSFDRNPCGPFTKIERIEGTNDWVSTGTGEDDPHKGYFTYNIGARLNGAEAAEVDPVIYNHGKPPDTAGEGKGGGKAATKSSHQG
jgi:hypothetical protein